jgi:predicted nucleic acid-binding protein
VTTDAVLTEVADVLCRSDQRRWAVEAVRDVRSDPAITSVPGGAQLFSRGFELYGSRPDKDWSLTDCISFIVMKEQKINRALTADLHFVQAAFRAQAGFRALLCE